MRRARAAKHLLGRRAARSGVTGLRSQRRGCRRGLRTVQKAQPRPWDSTCESAHHSTGSGVFIGVILLRQSHRPVIRGSGLGGVRVRSTRFARPAEVLGSPRRPVRAGEAAATLLRLTHGAKPGRAQPGGSRGLRPPIPPVRRPPVQWRLLTGPRLRGGGGGEGLLGYSPPWAARPGAPPPSKTSGLSASSEVRTFRLSLKRPEWETRRLRRLPPPPPAPAASPPPKGGGCSSRPPGLEGAAGASLAAAAGGGGAAGASLCFFLLVSDFHQGPAELPFTPARGAAVAAALSAISGSCGGRVGEESEGRLAAGHAATPPAGAPPPLGPAPGLSGRRRGPLLPGTEEAGSPPGAAGEVCPSPRELPSRGQAAGWARGEDFALRPRPAEPR